MKIASEPGQDNIRQLKVKRRNQALSIQLITIFKSRVMSAKSKIRR